MQLSSKFPDNFYWGAATSAHQVEGGNHNDWTEFEKRRAKRQRDAAKKRDWPDFIVKNYPNPLQEENYISGKSCDHYNRFREDFDIAKSFGHNAHRFSIEWSRVEPEEGKFNQKEIEHYREVIKALRERGMEPFVTLWHWTLPLWFAKKGGWSSRRSAFYFSRFCEKVAEEFKNEVKFWIILNEPGLWIADAYLFGTKPPMRRNLIKTAIVYFRLVKAHQKVYTILKKIDEKFFVGISESGEWTELTVAPQSIRHLFHYLRNYFFLSRIRGHLDFIGLNYYRRSALTPPGGGVHSDVGWEVDPEGIYYRLRGTWLRFKKPLFVTENGLADARDIKRPKFIEEHIAQIARAIGDRIDVRGYFHWSLLDNFEWEKGFWPRFGLVEVDYKTMERKIRGSAKIYKEIIDKSKL